MPTFLVTRKMDPALASRVAASISRRRKTAGERTFTPRITAVFRLVLVMVMASSVVTLAALRRRATTELEASRARLLATIDGEAASLTADETRSVDQIEEWLRKMAAPYQGDSIDDAVRSRDALAKLFSEPMIYVRGAVDDFTTKESIADAAASSPKDALVLCLVDPPAARAEHALLGKVRIAYSGGLALFQPTSHVRRLADAESALPFLLPPFRARVQQADGREELMRLTHQVEKAPLAAGRDGAKAKLLLYAMDDAGNGDGPTELDGERAHDVRVGVVDIVAGKVLFALRRRVDPSWISLPMRPRYASGLDGCALAFDVRQSLAPAKDDTRVSP